MSVLVVLGTLLMVMSGPESICEGAVGSHSRSRFIACIETCSQYNMECNDKLRNYWDDYSNKRVLLRRHLKKCCLLHENDENANPEDSFAACARIHCGAQLWGCEMVKKHSGFKSKEEKEQSTETPK